MNRKVKLTALAGMSLLCTLSVAFAQDAAIVGYTDLQARLGAATPTGTGIQVGQIEAGTGDYAPNPTLSEFVGKTFLLQSGFSGFSGHANAVGFNYYGDVSSIASGVTTIYNYEANNWLTAAYLRVDSPSTTPPGALPGPIKVFNSSWIGQFTSAATNNAVLRRADFAVIRDNVLMINGMDNDEPGIPTDGTNPALMGHMFNGLAVGVRDGTHTHTVTASVIDGPGRLKPEIVAPADATSWGTPIVSAAATLLVQTAQTAAGISANPNARRTEVLKAAMLAGAKKETAHGAPWTNNPVTSGANRGVTSQPIDAIVGAGTVNINNSHLILTGGEQNAAAAVPASTTSTATGWDLVTVGPGESRYWRFNVTQTAAAVTIAATWHRQTDALFSSSTLANFNLYLWRVTSGTTLQTLVGDPGLPYFGGGNVVSQSIPQNIEYLYINNLAPGAYVLELRRSDALTSFPNWDAAVAWLFPIPPPILGDLDGNGVVNGLDLAQLLGAWTGAAAYRPCPPFAPADLNHDCKINGVDLALLLGNWG